MRINEIKEPTIAVNGLDVFLAFFLFAMIASPFVVELLLSGHPGFLGVAPSVLFIAVLASPIVTAFSWEAWLSIRRRIAARR